MFLLSIDLFNFNIYCDSFEMIKISYSFDKIIMPWVMRDSENLYDVQKTLTLISE